MCILPYCIGFSISFFFLFFFFFFFPFYFVALFLSLLNWVGDIPWVVGRHILCMDASLELACVVSSTYTRVCRVPYVLVSTEVTICMHVWTNACIHNRVYIQLGTVHM